MTLELQIYWEVVAVPTHRNRLNSLQDLFGQCPGFVQRILGFDLLCQSVESLSNGVWILWIGRKKHLW